MLRKLVEAETRKDKKFKTIEIGPYSSVIESKRFMICVIIPMPFAILALKL